MNCREVESELVGYHFGVVDEDPRREIEGHLLCCSRCLEELFALKRDIETGDSGPRPSRAAHSRLRAAVTAELGLQARRREWRWWERSLALGCAAAAVLIALLALNLLASSNGARPHAMQRPSSASVVGSPP